MTEIAAPVRSRAATVVQWILRAALAVVFVSSAVPKLDAAEPFAEAARAMGVGVWFFVAIGVLEVAGAIALFVPRLVGLAATCFALLMIGAVITQVVYLDGATWYVPAVLMVASAYLAWQRRGETVRVFRR